MRSGRTLAKWPVVVCVVCAAAVLVHLATRLADRMNGGGAADGEGPHGSLRTIGRAPMALSDAAAQLTSLHADLVLRQRRKRRGYNVAMALSPGDPKTRTPVRYWAFDIDKAGDGRWIAYPRSLPGVYYEVTTGPYVMGGFVDAYFTENGDVVSVVTKKGLMTPWGDPQLFVPLSTAIGGHLYDDSGEKVEMNLTPQ